MNIKEKLLIDLLADGKAYSANFICTNLACTEAELIGSFANLESLHLTVIKESINTENYYKLTKAVELLELEYIKPRINFKPIHYFYSLDSTNQFLLQNSNLPKGSLCIAEHQAKGRGRRAKTWFSPFAENLYYSVLWLLNPKTDLPISVLSPLIGITIIKTLTALGVKNLSLKWPNDIYLEQKKLCGILIETVANAGQDLKLVIGIGLNLQMQEHAETEKLQAWTSLVKVLPNLNKNEIVIALSNNLQQMLIEFEQNQLTDLTQEWQKYDTFFAKKVRLIGNNLEIEGFNRGINHKGELLLEQENKLLAFAIGDISLRPI